VLDVLTEASTLVASHLTSPDQRLYLGYLCTAALLALWVFRQLPTRRGFLSYLFDRRIWLGPSACLDYQLVVFNSLVKVLLLGQYVVYGVHITTWVSDGLSSALGTQVLPMGLGAAVVGYTLVLTVFGDLTVYAVHRLMHQVPLLWAFHRVHHSATTLTPVTQLRLHPIELILNNTRGILVFGLVTGLFDYLAGHQVSPLTFLGVNAVSFVFFSMGANLRHSHVPLSYWHVVEHIFISPRQHQIHHSTDPRHHNRNFGSRFALWDLLFGTLVPSRQATCRLRFGLGRGQTHPQTLLGALTRPFL